MMGSGSDDESADEQDLYVTKEDVKDEFKVAQMLGGGVWLWFSKS